MKIADKRLAYIFLEESICRVYEFVFTHPGFELRVGVTPRERVGREMI